MMGNAVSLSSSSSIETGRDKVDMSGDSIIE